MADTLKLRLQIAVSTLELSDILVVLKSMGAHETGVPPELDNLRTTLIDEIMKYGEHRVCRAIEIVEALRSTNPA